MDYASTIFESFGKLNQSSIPMETITVEVTDGMFGDFAKAFIREAGRIAPLILDREKLTEGEVVAYVKFLISERVKSVKGECTDWQKLKLMYIPSWIQYNLRMVGECVIRKYGLKITPEYNEKVITLSEALVISEKIGAFEDVMQIVKDAMPRTSEGDTDVMTTAMIAGYMRSIHPVEHPIATYIAAFMGMKLKEEAAFKILYRIQYDDIEYIRQAIISQREIFK